MPLDRDTRKIQNSKQNVITDIDMYPSGKSVPDGDLLISLPSGKPLRLYKKLKGMLWWVDFTNNGNQFVNKNLEIKQNLTVDNSVGIGARDPVSLLEVRGGVGTGFTGAGQLTLSTAEETIVDNDVLGVIAFQSPRETGADAILPSAAIWGESEATFDASNNDTALVFATANSETVLATAQERMRIDSSGNVGIGEIAPEGNLHISSLTDATLILEADTDDATEGDNPKIELRQDGNAVHGFLGIEGDAGSLYTNSLSSAFYLEAKNNSATTSNIQFVTGGDYDATNPVVKGAARMTITATGIALIGRTSPAATTKDPLLEVAGFVSFDGFMSREGEDGDDDNANYINFFWDGTYLDGWVDDEVVWPNETSDYRIKENVTDVSSGVLEKINALRPIHFTQKEIGIFKKFDEQRVSFIAHELEEQFPDIVKGDKDAVNDDGDPVFQSYNNAQLTAYLVKAVQELSAKVTVLENN